MMTNTRQLGYSMVEMLIVIAIIGIIATLASISLNKVARNTRDAKRLTDMSAMRRALDLYKLYNASYPDINFQPGTNLVLPNESKSLIRFPHTPYNNSGGCGNVDYVYTPDNGAQSYHIRFCLDSRTQNYPAGYCDATPKDVCEIIP